MNVYCVYPAMSKKSENLSDLSKKDRNKRHSSPFINVVKGVFFVTQYTFIVVKYKIHLYSLRNRPEKLANGSLFCLFLKLVQINFIFTDNVRILYMCMNDNKCCINVVKGVFFVVRVTLVPVSYLSAPSTVPSYRVPGKFIRRLKSLFVGWKVYSSSTNKAKIYSYSIFVQQMYRLQDKFLYKYHEFN
jgi:hypothetical protein